MKELPKAYEAGIYEKKVYTSWEELGYFNPDNLPGSGKPFSISMPPPNATGTLHLGHATMLALQDLMVRFQRLGGRKVLWLPGTDHASIATQNVVEKDLWKNEKKKRFDFNREDFVRLVGEFAENSKSTIRSQIRAMGASCDWSRERYTLDAGLSQAVREVFVSLYNKGLIYRGKRIVNWCTRCSTTLADDEVEYQPVRGKLYFIKYGPVTVATTRPETKIGDTGLAVNPEDKRYQDLVGQELEVKLGKVTVKVKVIADRTIDQNFGSGVVGVTPAHSLTDSELAQKYNLPSKEIIGPDGRMTKEAGAYAGLTVKEAREQFLQDLGSDLDKVEDYEQNLSVCYRCGTPVEPLPSEQWFVAVDKPFKLNWFRKTTLKKLAIKAVRSGKIKIIPDRFAKVYFQWMNNLHDWCISRQIWFGHRVPAWRCQNKSCQHWQIRSEPATTFIITRHGLTDWNEEGRIQGITDVPLDESEVAGTYELAKKLARQKVDVIISSPLMRARQTAAIFQKEFNCEVLVDERLHERNYGAFEGRLVDDIKKTDPIYYQDKFNYPIAGAENYKEIEHRLLEWLKDTVAKYRGQTVLVTGHTAVIRAFKKIFDNLTLEELSDFRPQLNEPLVRQAIGSCGKCGSWAMAQDNDTLDTWFSSSLWTFSTLGWPQKTSDLLNFHPTSVMETGYDIIFFWVARMILMTSYALKEIPFRTVYLHGLVRDKQGRKMSKSLGNGIDPLSMIDKYGADALRLSMIIGTTPGNDFRLYEEKIAGYRNFVNKLWNICRYILMTVNVPQPEEGVPAAQTLADKWILSRFSNVAELVTHKIKAYQFSEAGEALYDFTWHELADWYLEIAKLEGGKDKLLCYLLTQLLKLWHPYTPFVTEVLWREAFGKGEKFLMVQKWPASLPPQNKKAEQSFDIIRNVVASIRNIRVEQKLSSDKILSCALVSVKHQELLRREEHIIVGLRTKVALHVSPGESWIKVDSPDFAVYYKV